MTSPTSLSGLRVLVVSNEQPGRRMAGPAIRALNLARELSSAGGSVTLAMPREPDIALPTEVRLFGKPDPLRFRRMARDSDIVITQPQRIDVAAGLHRSGARVVYDLYVPALVEFPASLVGSGLSERQKRRAITRNREEYLGAVTWGDGFIVASRRQRDDLISTMRSIGRTDPERVPIAVVPFGLPPGRPIAQGDPVLRGVLVPEDAVILLWAGGVWDWFDPWTVIRAAQRARWEDDRIHLVFLGAGHPEKGFGGRGSADRLWRSPQMQEVIDDGTVIAVDRWVPYADRASYLLEADVGVCAHYDSPETWLSFRTRLLDHLWSGLPSILTEGGVLGDLMVGSGAAISVPDGDVAAWSAAMVELADDVAARDRMGEAAVELAEQFTWPMVVAALTDMLPRVLAGAASSTGAPGFSEVGRSLWSAAVSRLREWG